MLSGGRLALFCVIRAPRQVTPPFSLSLSLSLSLSVCVCVCVCVCVSVYVCVHVPVSICLHSCVHLFPVIYIPDNTRMVTTVTIKTGLIDYHYSHFEMLPGVSV
jgi:hypothetical protein